MGWIKNKIPKFNFTNPSKIGGGSVLLNRRRGWVPNRERDRIVMNWISSGLLEGLTRPIQRENIAQLMEGEASRLLREEPIERHQLLPDALGRGFDIQPLVPTTDPPLFDTDWVANLFGLYNQDDYEFDINLISPKIPKFCFMGEYL